MSELSDEVIDEIIRQDEVAGETDSAEYILALEVKSRRAAEVAARAGAEAACMEWFSNHYDHRTVPATVVWMAGHHSGRAAAQAEGAELSGVVGAVMRAWDEAFNTLAAMGMPIRLEREMNRLKRTALANDSARGGVETDYERGERESVEAGALTANEAVLLQIEGVLRRQQRKWTFEHDRQHEAFEWLGLVAQYAASGRWVDAAALCASAYMAEQANKAALGRGAEGQG